MKGRGFSLVEIMIVVAIIAMVASIALPNFRRVLIEREVSIGKRNSRSFAEALEGFSAKNGYYPTEVTSIFTAVPPYMYATPCKSLVALSPQIYNCYENTDTSGSVVNIRTYNIDPMGYQITGYKICSSGVVSRYMVIDTGMKMTRNDSVDQVLLFCGD